MDTTELINLLDAPTFDVGRALGSGSAVLFGRDVRPTCGVVATVRSSRSERYVSFYAWWKRDGQWDREDVFEAGDRWPLTLPAISSERRGFRFVSGVQGRAESGPRAGLAIRAGVAIPTVRRVEVTTPLDRHDVALDPASGYFVAICLLNEGMSMVLTAYDAEDRPIDESRFELEVVQWDEDD